MKRESSGKGRDSQRQRQLYALADPTRRNIVELLARNEKLSATEICHNFTITHPAVSQHLKVLREAELIYLEKSAQKHLFSLNPMTVRELEGWVAQLTELWSDRFERLDGLLEAEKKKAMRGSD